MAPGPITTKPVLVVDGAGGAKGWVMHAVTSGAPGVRENDGAENRNGVFTRGRSVGMLGRQNLPRLSHPPQSLGSHWRHRNLNSTEIQRYWYPAIHSGVLSNSCPVSCNFMLPPRLAP